LTPRTHVDTFSGIGGFALAAGWCGLTTIQFCEINPFCRQVLSKHWPDVPIHDDITTFLTGKEVPTGILGDVFLLTGGFP
jgi:DNA (cytosine-5)-methyltransferase 1